MAESLLHYRNRIDRKFREQAVPHLLAVISEAEEPMVAIDFIEACGERGVDRFAVHHALWHLIHEGKIELTDDRLLAPPSVGPGSQ